MNKLVYISLVSAYDVVILLCMIWQGVQTNKALPSVDYFEHRSRIVGYRAFVFYSCLYYTTMMILELLIYLATPPGVRLDTLVLASMPP